MPSISEMATEFNLLNIIVALAAFWGAILGTHNAVIHWKENRTKIKVRLSYGFFGYVGGPVDSPVLHVTAFNKGLRSATLYSVGIALPDNKHLSQIPEAGALFPQIHLPYKLQSGENCGYRFRCVDLAKAMHDKGYSGNLKIRGFFEDGTNRKHRSGRFLFEIDGWLKESRKTVEDLP